MHSYPIYQDYQQKAEPLAGSPLPAAGPGLGQRRQPDRACAGRTGVGELLLDAGGQAGDRARLQLSGRRPGLPGASSCRAQLRLLGEPVCPRPERDRQEDPRQRLADDDCRRLGGGLCRNRPGAVAADQGAGADEAGDDAGVELAAHGRSSRALGPGVCEAEARLHGRVRARPDAGPLHADPDLRDDAPGGEGLVCVFARAVHEGPAARDERRDGLFLASQRFLDAARRADVHGRPGAAHRVRQRGEPAHRAGLHAAEGDRRASVARLVSRQAGASAARRESGPVVRRRHRRPRARVRADAGTAGAHSIRRPTAPDPSRTRSCAFWHSRSA